MAEEFDEIDNWVKELDPEPNLTTKEGNLTSDDLLLPLDMTFNDGHLVAIVSYAIMMVIGGIGNISVVVFLLTRKSSEGGRISFMLLHLAIADLLVTFILMPLEIGWAATVSWKGGDLLCRIMAFFRTFGLYLSGFVLICISIDRYNAIMRPLRLHTFDRRGKLMISTAWVASAICSLPQALVFHVARHPDYPSYEQCVTYDSFTSETMELVYQNFGLFCLYGLPLSVIIFCYSAIICKLCKKARSDFNKDIQMTNMRSDSGRFVRAQSRRREQFFVKAKCRTVKMTLMIVGAFTLCWTPYNIMCIWYWFFNDSAKMVDVRIQKALFLFACTNSCVNPIVYGMYNLKRRKEERSEMRFIEGESSTKLTSLSLSLPPHD